MSQLGNLGARLYRGEVGYDFVGKRKIWYGISILITITAIVGLAVRGLNMGIEFQGGAVFTTPKTSVSVAQAERVRGGGLRPRRRSSRSSATADCASRSRARHRPGRHRSRRSSPRTSRSIPDKINAELVGPSWGEQIANKAWLGLGIFMVLVVIYLAIAFEWRMALAALIALIHDLTITVGIYALVGFEVTPGTVIGLLTILGYSLYDTVVVFDSLKEGSRRTSPSRPAAPTARSPTARSTAPWCAPSTPRSSRCCRSPACCSSVAVSSAPACSTTSRCRCSSASPPVRTPRSSSPRRSSPTSRSASRR